MKKSSINHIFRTIWSEVLNAWVAVSELVSAKGKRSGSSSLNKALNASTIHASGSAECNDRFRIRPLALAVIFCFSAQAQANPIGSQVINGTAAISQAGNTLTVTNSPNAIINWQGFSINPNETTNFVQQSAASSVLNRVVGPDPSQLLGTLTSNGKVFLINPSGILVGQGARIDVAGFVASTLNLSNEDFLADRLNFGSALNAGGIQNAGSITTPEGGTVYLVAPQVENAGLISTPKGETLLAAGNTVQLIDTGTPGVTVQVTGTGNAATNLGQILADSGRIGMVAAVVKNSGTISASSLVSQGGKIFLKASQRTEAGGTVSASGTTGGTVHVLGNEVGIMDGATVSADGVQGGGTILVGGDYQGKNPGIPNARVSYVAPTAALSADALQSGNGGKVIVWADDTTRAYGSISVRGGAGGGNGGFVETSGHRYLDVTRAPDLTALSGKGGSWLLDPEDITISSAAGSNITGTSPYSPAAAGSSILSDAVLRAALVLGGTVTVDTTGGTGTTGSIFVDGTASLTNIDLTAGASTLYLKAHNDITVNSSITAINNPLTMYLIADQDSNSTGAAYINKALNSNNGNINISAFGDIALNDGTTAKLTAGTGTVTLTSAGGAIIGNMTGVPLDISAASVQLTAASGISAGAGPFYVNAGAVGFNNAGSQLVRIYNSRVGASSFTGSTGGPLALHSSDSANPTSIGSITAGGDIKFQIDNININNPINAGANAVYLAPFTLGNPVSIHGGATFDLSSAEISSITAGKIVVGYDGYNFVYPSVAQVGTGSAVSVTNAANLEIWGNTINTGPTAFSNAGGSVGLFGDAMTLAGPVSSAKVWLRGASSGQNIDLGGADAAGTLGLTATELGQITATTLFIGDPLGTGNLHVSSATSPTVTTLGLGAGGGITQSGAAIITATNLAIQAGGNVVLDTAPNVVTNLAAQVSGSASNFSFTNAAALNVGANIDGLSGISMSGFVNPGGMIALISTGALTQSADALLGGSAVYAEGSKVILTQANPTGVIAGKATGSVTGDIFSYTSINGVMVTTVNGFSGIQTASPPDAVSVVLNAGSAGISQNAPIFAGAGTHGLSLITTGPVGLTAANSVGALTATNVGPFAFNNAGALIVGIAGNGVTTTGNQPISIYSGVDLTVNAPVNAGTGNISLTGANLYLGSAAATTVNGGWVNLVATQNNGMFSQFAGGTISSAYGLNVVADNISLGGTIAGACSGGGGCVNIKPFTVGRAMEIAGASPTAGTLSVTQAVLAAINPAATGITGGSIMFGDGTAGAITFTGNFTSPGNMYPNLRGTTISQAPGTTINGMLDVIASGAITLTEPTNQITNLGYSFTSPLSVAVATNVPALTLMGTVSAGSGLTVTNSGGGITVSGATIASTINLKGINGIVLDAASSLTASGAGNAIVLNAGTGGLVNNATAGAAALANTGGGRWLVYAASPASVVKGGLTSNFRHYNATDANYAAPTETGNGFIYASLPGALTVNTTLLSGVASNTFGTAPTATFGYTLSGFADSEDTAASIGLTGSATFTPAISSTTPAGGYTVGYLSGLASTTGYTFTPGIGLAYTVNPTAPAQVAAPVIQQAVATTTTATTTATTTTTTTTTTTAATDPTAATAPVVVDTVAVVGTTTATTDSPVTLAGPAGGTIGGTSGTFGGDSVLVATEPMPATDSTAATPATTTSAATEAPAAAPSAAESSGSGGTTQQDDSAKQDSTAKKDDAAKKDDGAGKDDTAKKDDSEKKENTGKKDSKDDKGRKDKPNEKPEKC